MGFFSNMFGGNPKGLKRIDVRKRFDMMNRTGQGSMSKVFRAYDRDLGRTVCLKVLDKAKTAKFDERFPGLKRPSEGELCLTLRHPNIVQTYEHGITPEREQCLIMEWIDGMGLNFLVETRAPQLQGKRIDYLIQMANALDYLHGQKFMHRDICPRNVMVTTEGKVKLIDFGLTIPYKPEFCKPGNRTGTPNYLAPEVIKRTTTDLRVDLFALGVTAYEIFTNTLPWEKGQSMQTLLNHMNSPGRDPREFVPDLDPAVAELLVKAVERDRALRFQSAGEFRDALRALPKKNY